LNQQLFLFPLKDKVLFTYNKNGRTWQTMRFVVIIGAVGLVILLIACFNFINLAIAMNIKRFRETGIKKVVGSKKSLIVYQFLGETCVIITAGLVSAMFLVNILLPLINAVLKTDMHLNLLNLRTIGILTAIALFTGSVAGLLPAFYLASSNPVNILKEKSSKNNSYSVFRQGLIVFQFTIPVVLIICMMIIRTQDRFMRDYDVGVEKDNLIVMNMDESMIPYAANIKSDLLKISGVEGVSLTNCIPTRGTQVSNDVTWEGKDPAEKLHFWCIHTDFEYNKVVKMQITDGRFFDPSFPSDSNCYVINDVAAQVMNLKNPVGTPIVLDGKKGVVIGVFRNFHTVDLSGPFTPVIINIHHGQSPIMLIKFASGSVTSIMDQIRKIQKHYNPESAFKATLFADLIPFRNLRLPSKSMGIAFIIALGLACLGLFGLASFTSEKRTKEIGIRKTNGATTFSIIRLLLSKYMKWLCVSFIIAIPIAFILGKIFLAAFFFHAALPLWAFIAGPAIASAVALITVGALTLKVAGRNPVEALRYE
jgi:ABC-type antimicrobial peptide transport system permease subunit